MKKLIALSMVVFSLVLGANANAGCTSNTIGETTFFNCVEIGGNCGQTFKNHLTRYCL